MVDPSMLSTEAYKMLKQDYEAAIYVGPTYICNVCWKCEYRQNVCKFISENYVSFLTNWYKKSKRILSHVTNRCSKSLYQCKLKPVT